MKNILFEEWVERLNEIADRHGAFEVNNGCARWQGGATNCSFTLEPGLSPDNSHLKPTVRTGSSSALPADPLLALMYLSEMRSELMAALAAWVEVEDLRVWSKQCPCDYCSMRGCPECRGTGYRQSMPKEGA